jgi:DNA-binding transcriptional ArsR family regulator
MRPPKHSQSSLLRPLNEILGTQANVRLMRALALSTVPLTSGELAKRAELGRTSIYPALNALERAGIVEFVGAGSQRQVQMRQRHPLARPLAQLFQAEARRFEELVAALRELVAELSLQPMSAWAEWREQDDATATLRLYFVARPEEVEKLFDDFNSRLAKVEQASDVHVAVHGLTRSELKALSSAQTITLNKAILLAGAPPIALLEPSRPGGTGATLRSHDEHDARSRRLALAIATKIKRDPGLLSLAQHRIQRRTLKASPGERRELTEWKRVLSTMSPARLRRFLLENSERAIRLRQSLPALNLLSPAERDAVIRSRTDADVIAAMKRP